MSLGFPAKPLIFLISLDLLDFPLHFLYKYKGNQANRWFRGKFQIQINLSQRFFGGLKKIDIFEQEIMPSRAWDAVTITCFGLAA